ncbi:MAG: histidine phosphatase family protein [Anaerolineales bacterium]|nr:histidine phosphatase family protein [Anaerolineales bacterium]MCX7755888.1 histidine phosphatase family protein [Anaerolineales bacterium]MDW8277948.1 histidine phosphatase family protein [Anaerolineales bacterium]
MSDVSVFHITLLRHGESVGNAENRLQGHADFPLSETGREQARKLAARWKVEGVNFDCVITSPLLRARETAQIIAEALGIPNFETDSLWMERNMGLRSGMTLDEIRARYPEPPFLNPYQSWSEQGESDWELYLRGGQALHKLLLRPPARYLVVSHGAILNKVLYSILGITPQANRQGAHFRLENTSFSVFTYTPHAHHWRVQVIGDTHHLNSQTV